MANFDRKSSRKIAEPIKIGNVLIKNRIVMAPMTTLYAGPSGEVTDQLIRYYLARARGGTGLIVVEASYIYQGCHIPGSVGVHNETCLPGLARLADAIKSYGTVACLQLIHAGIQASHAPLSRVVADAVGPSAIGRKIYKPMKTPRELTTEEVEQIVEDFADASFMAQMAGFDMVQLHGAHGYLIQQFLSPLTNKRTDKYGEDRELFAAEIVRRAKEKCGKDYPMIWRLCGDELIPGGITIEDAKKTAKKLEQLGIDAIDVSGGSYDSPKFAQFLYDIEKEGTFIDLSLEVKKVTNLPVIGGTAIDTPEAAEKFINDGMTDMVYVGRALIADPEWSRKALEGRKEDIRPCSKCGEGCSIRIQSFQPIRCSVNPVSGSEFLWIGDDNIPKAVEKKKVLIIGGGPGGLECARVLDIRGHDVTLIEKRDRLGGALNEAAIPAFKERIARLIKYYEAQIKKSKVKVMTNTTISTELIREVDPDVVVVATGSEPLSPKIPGIEKSVLAEDVLLGKANVGKNVIVLGGGIIAAELALHLAKDSKVTVVKRTKVLSNGWWYIRESKDYLLNVKLPVQGVEVHAGSTLVEVCDDGVILVEEGAMRVIKGDTIVNALGRKSVVPEKIVSDVTNKGKRVYLVGDAKSPRKAKDAIYEGFVLALDI